MEAALAAIGLLSPATVDRAGERLSIETLAGSTPGELLQVANVACWKWAAGTAAETVEHGRRSLAAARAQAADASDSVPIYEALWVLCYADAHELALSVLDDTLADARGRGSVFGISTSCALRALIALQRGDVTTAEQEARTATVLPGLSGFVRPPLFGVLAQALVARGDLEGAERAIAESGCGPSLPEFVCLNPAFYARARLVRLAQGRHEAALADFYEFGERSARIALTNPGDPWRLGAAECLLRLDCPDEAIALADEQLALARRWDTPAAIGIALHGQALAMAASRRRSRAPPRCSRAPRRGSNTRAASWTSARRCGAPTSAPRHANRCAKGSNSRTAAARRRCGGAPTTSSWRGRPAAATDVQRPGRAHAERAPRRRARRRGHEQPRDRAAAVRDDQDGRQPPRAGLRQARDLLAGRARGGVARAGRNLCVRRSGAGAC